MREKFMVRGKDSEPGSQVSGLCGPAVPPPDPAGMKEKVARAGTTAPGRIHPHRGSATVN